MGGGNGSSVDIPGSPSELGLPGKFSSWREGQPRVIARIEAAWASGARVVVASLPTGWGKSLIGAAVASRYERAVFVTAAKQLQDQMLRDFGGSPRYADIRGRMNYACDSPGRMLAEMNASQAKALGMCGSEERGNMCALREERSCAYYRAAARASIAQMVAANYWLLVASGMSNMEDLRLVKETAAGLSAELLVLDEAHRVEDILTGMFDVSLSPSDLKVLGGVVGHVPDTRESRRVWRSWLTLAGYKAGKAAGLAETPAATFELLELSQSCMKATLMSDACSGAGGWYFSAGRGGVRFAPFTPLGLPLELVLQNVPRVLMMSATISEGVVRALGLAPWTPEMSEAEAASSYVFIEEPSLFPVERRPIYSVGNVQLNFKSSEGQKRLWLAQIDRIVEVHGGERGLVHAVSYDRAKFIVDNSRVPERYVLHERGERGAEALERFMGAGPDAVLVSPSMSEGVDLDGDACRFQIMGKIPYKSTQDPVEKSRGDHVPGLVGRKAAETMSQQYGRVIRSERDWAVTYVVDASLHNYFYRQNKVNFTGAFREALDIGKTEKEALVAWQRTRKKITGGSARRGGLKCSG